MEIIKKFVGSDAYTPNEGDVLVFDETYTGTILYGKEKSRTETIKNGKKAVIVDFYDNGTQFVVLPNGDAKNAFIGRLSFTFGWQALNNVAEREAGEPIRPQCAGEGVETALFDQKRLVGATDREEKARALFKGAYQVKEVEEFDFLFKGKEYHCHPPKVVRVTLPKKASDAIAKSAKTLLATAKTLAEKDLKEPLPTD